MIVLHRPAPPTNVAEAAAVQGKRRCTLNVSCMGKCRLLLLLQLLLLLLASSAIEVERHADGGKGGTTRSDGALKSALTMAIPAMLVALQQRANHSWLLQLRPDPRQQQFVPNRTSREVFSGHYVEVAPTPLPQPSLIIHRCAALYLQTPPPPTPPPNSRFSAAALRWPRSSASTTLPSLQTPSSISLPATATRCQVQPRPLGRGREALPIYREGGEGLPRLLLPRPLMQLQACVRGLRLTPSA